MSLVEGKVCVVTAAAGTGIGFATARRAVEEGGVVVVSDRHERRLGESAAKLSELAGTEVLQVVCDVTSQADVERLFARTVDVHGRLDVLVNNAGLGGTRDVADMVDAEWDRVMDVTLKSVMRCTREALKYLIPQGAGAIVNNASVLGWRAQKGQSHYAAAKAGVMALTRCSAVEVAEHGVRINAVAPSLAMHAFLHKVTTPELLKQLEGREAFGRAATPDEIANVILFLASDLSSYMTGEVLSVSSQHP